jgi:hypothetical protein
MIKKRSLSALFILTLLISFGCNKIQPTTATITVRGEDKLPLANIPVVLNATPGDNSKKAAYKPLTDINLISGSDGKVTYDFSSIFKDGQAGAAVIDIYASKIIGSDTLEGVSHVNLQPEKNNEVIVTIVKKISQN